MSQFDAIWDTGATGSVITQNVIDACGLIPVGMTQVHGVHGSETSAVYLINIRLPNSVGFAGIQVTQGNLGDSADVLIGMNIINQGDFSVTSKNGQTMFSFRVPSQVHTDYVKEYNEK